MSTPPTPQHYSTSGAAIRLGLPEWMIHRVFREGWLPEPPRIGRSRAIPAEQLPQIERQLREHGLLKDPDLPQRVAACPAAGGAA